MLSMSKSKLAPNIKWLANITYEQITTTYKSTNDETELRKQHWISGGKKKIPSKVGHARNGLLRLRVVKEQ